MDEQAVTEAITRRYADLEVIESSGNFFFQVRPGREAGPDRWLPFATLVTNDLYDRASRLERPSVFRLNVGVSPETYRSLFGELPRGSGASVIDTGHDYTALDRLMPHPLYAPMAWVCVLNPSEATFQALQPLLDEAHTRAARRGAARAERRET
ncbi:hypothetical protein DAERI_050134 [Deinococcus aerius]|uniref:DUF6194 domain-containing protein n=1 Tax=Deinococcus aerius TaxID=200253 RepID=A0A2I9DXV7_9DEIO|nr:DUF6194 family protein [Deinococcus aerius]GBF05625.1 hypothetical protein DAERI_050134 [Deinococcus aerius]